jgi:hypothetical protein
MEETEITLQWIDENTKVYYQGNKEIARWIYKGDYVDKKEGASIDGDVVNYNEEGNIDLVEHYVNNVEEGKEITWYPSGEVESNQYYKNDREDGEWIWFKENGEVERKEIYSNGELIKEITGKELKESNSNSTGISECNYCGKTINANEGILVNGNVKACKDCFSQHKNINLNKLSNNRSIQTDNKYPALQFNISFQKVYGTIIIICSALFLVYSIATKNILTGIYSIAGVLFGIFVIALGDVFQVFVDIEKNTRK